VKSQRYLFCKEMASGEKLSYSSILNDEGCGQESKKPTDSRKSLDRDSYLDYISNFGRP
jgi:hypothetical protein